MAQIKDTSTKLNGGDAAGAAQLVKALDEGSDNVDQKFDFYGLTTCGSEADF